MARGTLGEAVGGQVYRVRIPFKIGQSNCQTGFYLRDIGADNLGSTGIRDAVIPWADTHFRSLLYTGDQLLGVDVLRLTDKTGAAHSFSTTAGSFAITGVHLLPSFMMVPVSLKGEQRTRHGQGRMFWPVRSEEQIQGDEVEATRRTLFQNVLTALTDAFIVNVVTGDIRLCNYHDAMPQRTNASGAVVRPALPASWYDVTSARINFTVSALRSRKVNVGS